MTANRQSPNLTREERMELDALYQQIKSGIASSSIYELERFTDLFTKTLLGKGDDRQPTS